MLVYSFPLEEFIAFFEKVCSAFIDSKSNEIMLFSKRPLVGEVKCTVLSAFTEKYGVKAIDVLLI